MLVRDYRLHVIFKKIALLPRKELSEREENSIERRKKKEGIR